MESPKPPLELLSILVQDLLLQASDDSTDPDPVRELQRHIRHGHDEAKIMLRNDSYEQFGNMI